jgi:hypothetical protein
MANGRPGDSPFTDMLLHGRHPFPPDIEAMLRALHARNPLAITEIDFQDLLAWERGERLGAGRSTLNALCRRHGIDPTSLDSARGPR